MFCWSCKKDEPEDVGAETLILGKWELVRDSAIVWGEIMVDEYIPGGYVEFLPKGQLAWYDYQTKLYTLFEGQYLVENWIWFPSENADVWYLRYTNREEYYRQRAEIGWPFGLPDCFNNRIVFEDENTMIINQYITVLEEYYYIFKRINK